MNSRRPLLIEDGALRIDRIEALCAKPSLFAPDDVLFWDDPYIATQMLKAHLDPDVDTASRRPETIDKIVAWIIDTLDLKPGDALLDLGCGPGLYCKRFAGRGLRVTGVDYSQNSINYARERDPASTYLCQDYLTLRDLEGFEAVTLIYGDFCTFSDVDRDTILGVVHRALAPGGCFVFDVTTRASFEGRRGRSGWSAVGGAGFWRPEPHLALAQVFDYPDHDTYVDQYIVIEADGTMTEYRIWNHCYTVETITAALVEAGFVVRGIYGDLTGAPYQPDSEWMGIVAQKA